MLKQISVFDLVILKEHFAFTFIVVSFIQYFRASLGNEMFSFLWSMYTDELLSTPKKHFYQIDYLTMKIWNMHQIQYHNHH